MKNFQVRTKYFIFILYNIHWIFTDIVNNYPKPDAHPQIVGSIGPYGAALHDGSEYTGNYADKISKKVIITMHNYNIIDFLQHKLY